MVSSHEMAEFVWDSALRDMPLAVSFPRATLINCIIRSMGLSDAQLSNIRVFAGSIASPEKPAEFSRSLCIWMDAVMRSRGSSDAAAQAWPVGLPNLISDWHAQSRHVQWICIGPMGNVAATLGSARACERPDAVISACHQVAAKDAPVAENNVKLNPAAFTASLELARNSCTPLLILLLNTSGYFCQWLTAFSIERSTLELRCFHSSM